jgi:hypothetical protein
MRVVPRPLGRGDATPRRESPEGAPKAAAINLPWCTAALPAATCVCDVCLCTGRELWREPLCGGLLPEACLRSEPVSSDDPPPLLLHLFGRCDLGRRGCFACFWGVVSARRTWAAAGSRTGSEPREDSGDVSSGAGRERESMVEASAPAMALACVFV